MSTADTVSIQGIVVPNSGRGRSSPLSSLLEPEREEGTGDAQGGRNMSSIEGIGSLDSASTGVGPLARVSAEGDDVLQQASFGWTTISVWSLFLQLPPSP